MPFDPDSSSSDSDFAGASRAEMWDSVRKAFVNSIMLNTSLSSLAQNLEGEDWPLKGPDETPAKYLPLSYDELIATPGIEGHPERVALLITLLEETLAFDEPFGEMVTGTEGDSDKDNPILKNLARLGIPDDFPLSLVALTPETRDACNAEGLTTLKEFAMLAQRLAQTVIVAGDFRSFLNALSHIDEITLAQYLPFRPGEKGLHLLEGLALTVRGQSHELQASLAKRYGARLSTDDAAAAATASQLETTALDQMLAQHAAAYLEYFQADHQRLQQQLDDGVPLGRLASVLKDPLVESVVTGLLKPYLRIPASYTATRTTAPPVEDEGRSRGFFGALRRLFKK